MAENHHVFIKNLFSSLLYALGTPTSLRMIYVTVFWKTDHLRTFHDINLKY